MSPDLLEPRGRAIISKKGLARLRGGHLWVYESDIVRRPGEQAGIVWLEDDKGKTLGSALYSPRSTITLRRLTHGDAPVTAETVLGRLREAMARRERTLPGRDAWRWVHGEADLLPSVFIDRYADCVSMQILSGGADVLAPLLIEQVEALMHPRAIVVRGDATARRREGLDQAVRVVKGEGPVTARYHEGPHLLEVDLTGDQKTGGFLDQVDNHVMAARYASGQALDCFTYHGGFALQMAGVAEKVVAVDVSKQALARAAQNAARAGLANIEWRAADVLELLPALGRDATRFDTIVLDPPAFASNKASEPQALRAYKEINLRAMKLLRPGGILITCSCSGRVSPAVFDEVLQDAALDARRSVQILERRAAAPDHPVLVGVPETDYLKCRVLAVL